MSSILPGHIAGSPQNLVSLAMPLQLEPPCIGTGFVQERCLSLVPFPQVTLQTE